MALQGRAYRTYQKVCELRDHPGTPRHERQAAAEAAARMEQRYGFSPIRPPQPPPEPPRSRQNGRADSGWNHKQQREKPRTGANSRQSGPSGRKTWQAKAERPFSQYQREKQQEWQARERAKAQAEYDRTAYGEPPPRHETNRQRWARENAENARRYGAEPRSSAGGGGMDDAYTIRPDWDQFPHNRADREWREARARNVTYNTGGRGKHPFEYQEPAERQQEWQSSARPSTARAEQYPDSSSMDIAAVLVMGAIVAMFLSMAVLAALGGWFSIKQFLVIAGLFVLAGVLLVNIVME